MSEEEKKNKDKEKHKGEEKEEKKKKEEKKEKEEKKGNEEKKDKNEKEEKSKNKEKEEVTLKNENNLNILKEIKSNLIPNIDNIPPSYPFHTQGSLQILSSINNEMDSLSNTLRTKFIGLSSPSVFNQDFNFSSNFNINNCNNFYDKEDLEIKELLARTKIAINETETNLKLNNLFNKKYENKIIQSDDLNLKFPYNFSNNIPNSFNNNMNYNTNPNTNYKNNNNNYFENMNNKYMNKRNSFESNSFFEQYNNKKNYDNGHYKNTQPISLKKDNHYYNRTDFYNNKYNNGNINNKDKYENSFSQENNFNNYQNYNENSINKSILNKTKKIQDLYKYTNNIRRKPMVYTQPESPPLNNNESLRQRNFSLDNKYKYNNDINLAMSNMKQNNYTRFDNEGVNIAMDILTGKI